MKITKDGNKRIKVVSLDGSFFNRNSASHVGTLHDIVIIHGKYHSILFGVTSY